MNQLLHRYLKLAGERGSANTEAQVDVITDEMEKLWYQLPLNQRSYVKAIGAGGYHPIHPPAYKPTEEEHLSAFRLWCLEDIVQDTLLPYWMAIRGQLDFIKRTDGVDIRDREHKHLHDSLDDMFSNTKRDGEFWDTRWHVEHNGLTGYEAFKSSMEEDLASHHVGDCTYVACGCARCHAESRYGIPGTARWGGGSEGNRLLREWKSLQAKSD